MFIGLKNSEQGTVFISSVRALKYEDNLIKIAAANKIKYLELDFIV